MELKKHQVAARERYKEASVIPLFFAPGTGKTLTSTIIAESMFEHGYIDTILVIAPNGVDRQWSNQELPLYIKEGFLTTETMIYNNKKSKKPIPWVPGKLNICCVNIDQFSTVVAYQRYTEWLNAHGDSAIIILDEATRIKNPKAIRTQRLLYEFNDVVRRGRSILKSQPRTRARIILTGTPVTNGLTDVWAMFEFLQPNYFGMNWYAFQNKYCMFCSIDVQGRVVRIPITQEKWQCIRACETYEQANMLYGITMDTFATVKAQDHFDGPYKHAEELRQLMMRDAMFVKIEDVTDMPERTYIKRMIKMSAEQERVYNDMVTDMIAMYDNKETTATSKLTMYLRLQQIASGFISSQASIPEGLSEEEIIKFLEDPPSSEITWFDQQPKIDQLLIDLEEMDGPVIIVTHFSAEAEYLYEKLKDKYKVCLMTGWKRVGTPEQFQDGTYPVMVANIRVIAMGFNFQIAHYMMFYSNTFSLEDRIQVEARIYRTGQKNRCIYYDYIMLDTIDMKVYAALRQKKSLADYVTDKSAKECMLQWDQACQEAFEDVIF